MKENVIPIMERSQRRSTCISRWKFILISKYPVHIFELEEVEEGQDCKRFLSSGI
jgi:hypothetical protein